MSEKTEVDQEYEEVKDGSPVALPGKLPEHQYSKEKLLDLSKSHASLRRPKCLERAYDSDDGKWDPDRWYKAKFGGSREGSPLTLVDGKDRRRGPELDRDGKRRASAVNESVERLKEERDGIVLSPQRRSFGTGCHVQASSLSYTRQLSMPERDRDDSRGERDRDRERERTDRPVRKIGSGRIQIDRENSRDFAGLRERFDEREVRDRDREVHWSRDRDRDRERDWDRDVRDREVRERDRDARDSDWDRDRDRRFERSDRFRRVGDRDFPDRDRRDRDFRDRGFDRSRRRNNYHDDREKEPEWFTGGPTSQTDTIELRGFEREGEEQEDSGPRRLDIRRNENKKRNTPSDDKSSTKGSSEEASEVDIKVSQRSSPEEDQQVQRNNKMNQQDENQPPIHHEPENPPNPGDIQSFDFEAILKANLPLDEFVQNEDCAREGSRLSRFFPGMGGKMQGSELSTIEDMLVPHDLLDDNRSSPAMASPTPMVGPMGAMHPHQGLPHHGMHQFQDHQHGMHPKDNAYSMHQYMSPMPNSAGDNNAAISKSALPPSVTALFNSAAMGGSNASISSNSSFSTQDAEAQLKAMLFGGHKDSASSSGTASPASLPPNVQRKVKTVAELEADMHQNSPKKTGSPIIVGSNAASQANTGDMTAFNKLLIMMNAASEVNQNVTNTDPQNTHAGYGMRPSNSEFNHAVMRNKEEQMHLLQKSLQGAQRAMPQSEMASQLPLHPSHHHQMPPPMQQPPPSMSHQQAQSAAAYQQLQKQHQQQMQQPQLNLPQQPMGMASKPPISHSLTPQAMSTPHGQPVPTKPRAQSQGPTSSSDPIFNLIQQNPTIVMKPASPAPAMATMLASQQPAGPNTARVPSPIMFSQQPPLHLSAPSPIHPGQLSPRSLTVGANLAAQPMSSSSGIRSPVMPRVISPQELSAHAQAVMQGALIKKQLQDQSERYQKKQQERVKSPNLQQMNVIKPQPSAQPVLPPTPQPKGNSLNTFTPTSVLRKMHSDKAIEKEKQAQEGRSEEETEYMPSMQELSQGNQDDHLNVHGLDGMTHKADTKLVGDLSDISFLDPVNPNLVAISSQMENQLRISGQANILPGTLSQPMSVEEKMKLSALAEKPGYLSQMLDKAAAEARAGHGRPIVKGPEQLPEDRNMMQQHHLQALHQQQQMQQPPPQPNHGGRPVTGSGAKLQQPFPLPVPTSIAPPVMQQNNNTAANKPGRAIVGGGSIQQQPPPQMSSAPPPVSTAPQNSDIMRMLEQQHIQQQMQRMQQAPHSQGMVLPPPPMGAPIACLGPPPVAVPVSARGIPFVGSPVPNAALMQQQFARAQRNQQMSHYMAMQQAQHRGMAPLHSVVPGVPAPLSPHSQTSGPLSPAALSATIQRVASPHGAIKINGPLPPNSPMNGGGGAKGDMGGGIQRWFSPDILKHQLPSMPPLPTQGSHVMTVDELERN